MKTPFPSTIRLSLSLAASILVLAGAGCATQQIPGADQNLIRFLQIGKTTRQETMLKLGQPSASFERESILTYRLGETPKHAYYVITPKALLPWQEVRYSLVLVFDEKGVLLQQSLVDVQ